nr:hypothetical protein [Sphingomonas sp. Y57]
MSTPDTYAYKLLKLELRRLDPTNGILAFVEEIEADMVASTVPSPEARLREIVDERLREVVVAISPGAR